MHTEQDRKRHPFISIVMATHNAAKWLPRALASLKAQTTQDFELVVQDACSTDGTLRLLERFSGACSLRSEPDSGIYDAWNKALHRVRGDWCLFLGADDALATPDVLARVFPFLESCPPETLFAYGALLKGHCGTIKEVYKLSVNAVFINLACRMSLPFPATFVRSAVLKTQGFDASFKICGDYDFTLRNAAYGLVYRIPLCVTYMESGGVSDRPDASGRTDLAAHTAHTALHAEEHARVIGRHAVERARVLIDACIRSRLETDSELL